MSAAPAYPVPTVDRKVPREEMARFLAADRLYAGYALADLDRENVRGARWWVARRGDDAIAGALVMTDLSYRPLFLVGDPEGVALLLRQAIPETRVVVSAEPRHRPAVETEYRLERVDRMLRMAVDAGSFRPEGADRAVRLGPADLDEIIDLYGFASRTYFAPQRLERELYHGVYEHGLLVAAAGTHVRSREFGIAAVGNVLTRVSYRNRGYGRACSAAVTAACLREHRDVILNVREDNAPAVAVYLRLGYRVHVPFIESAAYRRTLWERFAQDVFGRGGRSEQGRA